MLLDFLRYLARFLKLMSLAKYRHHLVNAPVKSNSNADASLTERPHLLNRISEQNFFECRVEELERAGFRFFAC